MKFSESVLSALSTLVMLLIPEGHWPLFFQRSKVMLKVKVAFQQTPSPPPTWTRTRLFWVRHNTWENELLGRDLQRLPLVVYFWPLESKKPHTLDILYTPPCCADNKRSTCVLWWAHACVVIDSVHTGGVVLAVVVLAVVDVDLAFVTFKAFWTHTPLNEDRCISWNQRRTRGNLEDFSLRGWDLHADRRLVPSCPMLNRLREGLSNSEDTHLLSSALYLPHTHSQLLLFFK